MTKDWDNIPRQLPVVEQESRLYLEAHVTIEPVFGDNREKAAKIARCYGFKLADLLMKKDREATPERSSEDTFMTGHSKRFTELRVRMSRLTGALRAAGICVWRYKIEDTLVDSRYGDEYNLLAGRDANAAREA